MKNSLTSKSARAINSRRNSLKSLLTLASGAASLGALAPAAEAGIIYKPINATVGFGAVPQLRHFDINLPDGAILQLATGTAGTSHRVFAGIGPQYVGVGVQNTTVAFRNNAGANWLDMSGSTGYFGNIIRSKGGKLAGPGEFDTTKYLLFKFRNAGMTEYGWIGMSAATITPSDSTGMSVTFTGWAYDNTGAMIAAGAGIVPVPEVSTGVVSALMAAMFVGGVELRRWRKSKPANVSQSA